MRKLIFAALMAFVFMALAGQASADVPPGLNDTGQTNCYDASNAVADCATVAADDGVRPRQDARFGRDAQAGAGELTKTGAGAAGFDYTKICMSGEAAGTGSCPADPPEPGDFTNPGTNEWACTRDNVTNLVWSIETISSDWDDATNTHPTSYNSATRCGFSSAWRAPTRRELLSIVHHGTSSPIIDEDFFPNTPGFSCWSSDEYALNSSEAWGVSFGGGSTFVRPKTFTFTREVRLVHGTQLPDGSFTDNEDGTVTDTVTGLMWDKCSWGQSGDTDCATDAATTHTWAAALGVAVTANAANHKGYDDWRLPNRTELESLVDITASSPAIDTTAFPNTQSSWYWSSTTRAQAPANAWRVNFNNGDTNAVDNKSSTYHVRLVRSGQSFDALAPPFPGGDGTAGDPWQIATAEELDNVRNYLGSAHADKHFVLIADIDLDVAPYNTGEGWVPVGAAADENRFFGHFDGAGHIISGLFINRPGENFVGLFGYAEEASFENISLLSVNVTGQDSVGALLGRSNATAFSNLTVHGTVNGRFQVGGVIGVLEQDSTAAGISANIEVTGSGNRTGGLSGFVYTATIADSQVTGQVTGSGDHVGGMVGHLQGRSPEPLSAAITDSSTNVAVSGAGWHTGGLAGYASNAEISNSHAAGTVAGAEDGVGGLVGFAEHATVIAASHASGNVDAGGGLTGGMIGYTGEITISSVYATGTVTAGGSNIGGLIGETGGSSASISNAYATGPVSGGNNVGGLIGEIHSGSEITNAYATGLVSGSGGGLIGNNNSDAGVVTDSFYDSDTTGQSDTGNGEPRTTAEMKALATFSGDWDIVGDPTIAVNYPFLVWQGQESYAGDPVWVIGTQDLVFSDRFELSDSGVR